MSKANYPKGFYQDSPFVEHHSKVSMTNSTPGQPSLNAQQPGILPLQRTPENTTTEKSPFLKDLL